MARLKVPTGSCSVLAFSSHPSCLWHSFVFPSAKPCSQPRVEKWKKSNLPSLYPFHVNYPIFWNFIRMHQRLLRWQGIKSREKLSDCSKRGRRWGIVRGRRICVWRGGRFTQRPWSEVASVSCLRCFWSVWLIACVNLSRQAEMDGFIPPVLCSTS